MCNNACNFATRNSLIPTKVQTQTHPPSQQKISQPQITMHV
jgi:hypothetical protein